MSASKDPTNDKDKSTGVGKDSSHQKESDKAHSESLIDFTSFPSEALHSYISHYNLAPSYPPPSASAPAKSSRQNDKKSSSSNATTSSSSRLRARSPQNESVPSIGASSSSNPAPSTTTGKKRNADAAGLDSKGHAKDNGPEEDPPCPPHFFDAAAAKNHLSAVASKHFASLPAPKEGEVVVGFLYRCKVKGQARPSRYENLGNGQLETDRVTKTNTPRISGLREAGIGDIHSNTLVTDLGPDKRYSGYVDDT
ncbi:hypothetical protein IE53DRAFT_379999 [Violaceomyces palustris]|uniref:Uncharacterized protein n=1 Tax=Violaceomyces palustris TaxID=1673888 RepID=A0ACD0NW92_9BASI|nr:hypothetical protein IE53DRAFT_379999 [Violaceomyces palustris]